MTTLQKLQVLGQEAPIAKGKKGINNDHQSKGNLPGNGGGPIFVKTDQSEKDKSISLKVTDTQGHMYESTYQQDDDK